MGEWDNDESSVQNNDDRFGLTCYPGEMARRWIGGPKPNNQHTADGAKSHLLETDKIWSETLQHMQLQDMLVLYTQPANSPDLNINDLGFFGALQSAYYEKCPNDTSELIQLVSETFDEYDHKQINKVWLTLQSCLNCILEEHGGNHYKIPHLSKDRLEAENNLPLCLAVTEYVQLYIN